MVSALQSHTNLQNAKVFALFVFGMLEMEGLSHATLVLFY